MKSEIHRLTMWISNIKFPVYRIVFLLFFFTSTIAYPYNVPVKIEKTIHYDSSTTIPLKKISSQKLTELHQDKDYNYTQVSTQPKTAWERFWEWFWNKIRELFDTKSGNITIKTIRYAFLISALAFIIYLLFKNNARALFYGKSASVSPDFIASIEDLQEINFDKRIEEEVNRKDFRKAIRFYFLKIIKELSQQNLINWKLDKTNADYLKELRSSKFHSQFEELSRLYEYTWYGHFQLDEAHFLIVIQKFNQFKIN